MYKKYAVKDPLEENRIYLSRVVAAFVFIVLLTIGLITRLIYLQVVGHALGIQATSVPNP